MTLENEAATLPSGVVGGAPPPHAALPPVVAPRPPIWHVLVAYAAVWVGAIVVVGLVGFVVLVIENPRALSGGGLLDDFMSPAMLLASVAASVIVLAGVSLAGSALERAPVRKRLRMDATLQFAVFVPACVGCLALSQAEESLIRLLGWNGGGSIGLIIRALEQMGPAQVVLAVAFTGFGAGTFEEVFFRGYMQGPLCARLGRWAGITATAAAFGLLHADLIHTPFAFGIGMYLGWLTEKTGSIVPAIVAHATNNAIFVVLIWLGLGVESPAINGTLLALSLPMLVACIVIVKRTTGAGAGPSTG